MTWSKYPRPFKEGKKVSEIAKEWPTTFIRYHRGIRDFKTILNEDNVRDKKTCLVILTGDTGIGKFKFANRVSKELYPSSTYYKPRGEWQDGYEQQGLVIMDDFYRWVKYDELLKICDRYPYRVPIKGGFRQFT